MTDDVRSEPRRVSAAPGSPPPVLDQAFDSDSLYPLRAAVAAHASQAGLPDGRVRDVVLCVHELASNAVRHGAGHGRLRLWRTADAVRCEVTDEGPAREGPAREGTAPRDAALWRVEHGHGLWLVRQVADQASVQAGPSGTVAAVSFSLGPPPQLAPFGLAQRAESGCVIVTVTGPLDLSSAGEFGDAMTGLITATPGVRLVLDLAGLTWWDSSGLAALVTAQRWVSADRGARMVLAGLPGHLVTRLHEAGLAGRFTLAGSTAEAADTLRGASQA